MGVVAAAQGGQTGQTAAARIFSISTCCLRKAEKARAARATMARIVQRQSGSSSNISHTQTIDKCRTMDRRRQVNTRNKKTDPLIRMERMS
jgi:hypothetical protein